MNRTSLTILLAVSMAATVGCTSKNYVKQQTTPLINKTNELDDMTAKNSKDIKDVDARAQAGIQAVNVKTADVEQKAQAAGQSSQKFLQQWDVAFQIGRQLKQDRPQLACLLQRLEGRDEFRRQLGRPTKALNVRNPLMRLNGEFESRRRCIHPAIQQSIGREVPERIIHFDGVQARGVITQELGGSQLRRIETRLPAGIGPTRGACVDHWHRGVPVVRESL